MKITFRTAHKPAGFINDAARPWVVIRTTHGARGTHEDAVERYETEAQAKRRANDMDKRVNG